MPHGRKQKPGGWNRVVLQVHDLAAHIEDFQKAGLHFRNDMTVVQERYDSRPGGKQIQLEDPDGNPIELFEPALR
jgi:glyoxylase I family protein